MLRCKLQMITEYRKKTLFINPKCGHLQDFEYTTPFRCQHATCMEEVTKIDKLYGNVNQDNRVKFYAEGKV